MMLQNQILSIGSIRSIGSIGNPIILGLALLYCSILPATSATTNSNETNAAMISAGQKLAFDRQKGNCLACHQIPGGESPGNIGPPLFKMKLRYPDIARLRAQIWDATVINPNTSMPPFGRYRIVTESEIDQITAFIHSK